MPKGGNKYCHRHEHFAEYCIGFRRGRFIDASDLYSDEQSNQPTFSMLRGYELAHSAEDGRALKFIRNGNQDRRWHMSEDYWKNAVVAAMSTKSELAPYQNIQHTGAFVLWKGFGKKKIRKSQRNRPTGWHGNHPEQKPMKKWDRETLEDEPAMLSPQRAIYPKCQSYEILEPELSEEEERELIIEQLARVNLFDSAAGRG